MGLLDEYMSMTGGCVLMDKRRVPDGYGGYTEYYEESVEFDAAIVLNSSLQAKIAEQQGVTALYTITTPKNINLQFHDVFKRKSDNKIFRVLSDGDDKHTPASSSLDMREVSAEEYILPKGTTNTNT